MKLSHEVFTVFDLRNKDWSLAEEKSHDTCCATLAWCPAFYFLPSVFISYLVVATDQFKNTGACSGQLSKATDERVQKNPPQKSWG